MLKRKMYNLVIVAIMIVLTGIVIGFYTEPNLATLVSIPLLFMTGYYIRKYEEDVENE